MYKLNKRAWQNTPGFFVDRMFDQVLSDAECNRCLWR